METAINAVPDVHQAPMLRGGFSVIFKGQAAWKASSVAVSAGVFMGTSYRGQEGSLPTTKKKKGPVLRPTPNKIKAHERAH